MKNKKVTSRRWEIAQDSEEEYWKNYTTTSLLEESGERYPKKAKVLLEDWKQFIDVDKNIKILQVGCGPEDVINYFPVGERFSIDPLADFYKQRFDFDYNSSGLRKGVGEKIPFPDESFDVVLLINVLDHVHLPLKVLSEIKRVLKPKGIFHFENYFYQKGFIFLAKIWGALKQEFTGQIFNIHHPYMFAEQNLRKLLSKEFSILSEENGKDIGLYKNMKQLKNIRKKDKRLTVKLPAMIGLYGIINYTAKCQKKN